MRVPDSRGGPAAACALLAILHSWPLASAPTTLSLNANGDAQLNEWILAWVAHQLPRDPGGLFQANIFHPAADTLAFSEPLIVPALLGAPVAWLGGSPVLVMNLMVMTGLALTALAGYALLYRWTGDRLAALLTGSAFAFNTHTLTRLPHVQALHLYGLPLALLATDRLLSAPRTREAAWLALWMVVMAYTSGYLLVFGVVMVATATLVRSPEWLPYSKKVLTHLTMAAVAAGVAIIPLWVPYRRAAVEQGMVRSLESVTEFSASLRGYLAASGTVHSSTWSRELFTDPVDSFFPGVVVVALTIMAVASLWRASSGGAGATSALTRRRIVMLAAIAAVGLLLSLGTRTPVYGWVYAIFPPMQGLRAAARFGNLFLFGTAALAGLGLASVRARGRSSMSATAGALVLTLVVNLEALRAPFEYQHFGGVPGIYELLATEPRVVLAEVPFYPRRAAFENAEYVLNSTAHWRPLMNGYSGYTPASYAAYAEVFWYFPREHAIQAMRRAGVTHVMVHPARFGPEGDGVVAALARRSEFELLAIGSRGIRLYRLH